VRATQLQEDILDTTSSQDISKKLNPRVVEDASQRTKQSQKSEQGIINIPISRSVMKPFEKIKPNQIPKLTPTTTTRPIRFKNGEEEEEEGKIDGYNTFVRERGEIIKLTKKPLPINKALNVGAEVADNTPVRTFFLRKSNKIPNQLDSLPSDRIKKFNKKGNTYVEKNPFAIDTLGEHQGITVKGWLAKKKSFGGFL